MRVIEKKMRIEGEKCNERLYYIREERARENGREVSDKCNVILFRFVNMTILSFATSCRSCVGRCILQVPHPSSFAPASNKKQQTLDSM